MDTKKYVARILSEGLGWTVDPKWIITHMQGRYRSDHWELLVHDEHGKLSGTYACWETLTNFAKLATEHGWHVSDSYIYIGERCVNHGNKSIPQRLGDRVKRWGMGVH